MTARASPPDPTLVVWKISWGLCPSRVPMTRAVTVSWGLLAPRRALHLLVVPAEVGAEQGDPLCYCFSWAPAASPGHSGFEQAGQGRFLLAKFERQTEANLTRRQKSFQWRLSCSCTPRGSTPSIQAANGGGFLRKDRHTSGRNTGLHSGKPRRRQTNSRCHATRPFDAAGVTGCRDDPQLEGTWRQGALASRVHAATGPGC